MISVCYTARKLRVRQAASCCLNFSLSCCCVPMAHSIASYKPKIVLKEGNVKFWLEIMFTFYPNKSISLGNQGDVNRSTNCFGVLRYVTLKRCQRNQRFRDMRQLIL